MVAKRGNKRMAFVYEEVGEGNRELWESIGWKDWGENSIAYFKSNEWSVDRERHIYMQPIGSFIDTPDYHDLAYKGKIIRMEVVSRGSGTRATGFDMAWKIKRICIPKSIWEDKDEIIKEIIEAFLVCRGGHAEKFIKSISVEISCEPECAETDYNGR